MATPQESPTFFIRALPRADELNTLVLAVGGTIQPADLSGLCERVGAWLDGIDAHNVVCDVGTVVKPDAVTIDALARLQLAVRRFGLQLELRDVGPELRDLLDLTGLCDAIPVCEP